MKQIDAEIGVNESRVSQLHARAIRRLRDALGAMGPQQMAEMRKALIAFAARKPVMAKATLPHPREEQLATPHSVVIPYKTYKNTKKAVPARAALKVARMRQAIAAAR